MTAALVLDYGSDVPYAAAGLIPGGISQEYTVPVRGEVTTLHGRRPWSRTSARGLLTIAGLGMLVLGPHGDVRYPVRRADEAFAARETPQLLAGEKPKGRAALVRGGPRGIGAAAGRDRPGGNGYGAPLCAHASCAIMGKVRTVNGGQQI